MNDPTEAGRLLGERIADAVARLPRGILQHEAFLDEQEGLRGRTVASALPIGDPFPDAELLDATGAPTTLARARAGAPAVVIFYRGSWCPYCNLALAAYRRDLSSELARRGVVLVAVSAQHPDGSLTMVEKHGLDFPVLSDPGNRVAGRLGILTAPTDDAREVQRSLGFELSEANADGTATIPMPTVAVVGADGELRWIDIRPDYTSRTEPGEILAALDRLGL